ncbi:MAG: HNH endonuclease [Cytophagales bacterium]
MEFKLNIQSRNISDEELLADMKKVQKSINKPLSRNKYNELGKFSSSTIENRFGTWNKALIEAGLSITQPRNLTEIDLFKNIEEVWIKLGRQPKYDEIKQPLSKYSIQPYHNRFGKWNQALQAFVGYINSESIDATSNTENETIQEEQVEKIIKHKTNRGISDRLRFRILMRDGFTCKKCGRSPIKEQGVELHIDHLIPWSKGGETIPENLETKCKKCNLGKGNAFNV